MFHNQTDTNLQGMESEHHMNPVHADKMTNNGQECDDMTEEYCEIVEENVKDCSIKYRSFEQLEPLPENMDKNLLI